MPFIGITVAGAALRPEQVAQLQAGVGSLMVDIMGKVGLPVGILVGQVPAVGRSVGGVSVSCAAQVDAAVSAGTNTPEQRARFVGEAYRLPRAVLGPELSEVSCVVVDDAPKGGWGRADPTEERRARRG